MEKLLQWAVNNSNQEELKAQAEAVRRGEVTVDRSKFDPAIIEAILGKDDATRMREAVECITNVNDTIENREIALDNLELLVEGIDNAMNIEKMKLWPALIGQLKAKEAEIRTGVAWVCGTALQNNPQAQEAFLANSGLDPLLDLIKDEKEDKQVKAKATFALSGLLKHCAAAVQEFKQKGGFDILSNIVKQGQDPAALRKIVFMYNSLLLENPDVGQVLLDNGTLQDLDALIVKYTIDQDEDLVEKALRTAHTLSQQSKVSLSTEFKQHAEAAGETFGRDNLGLDKQEWKELLA